MPVTRKYAPGPPLSAFVHCFWYWEGAPQGHSKERLMPNGEPTIVFSLLDEPVCIYDADDVTRYISYSPAIISGPRTRSFVIDSVAEERVFGIQFRAGGTYPFFRSPTSDIQNASFDLTDLWSQANEFREQLLESSSIEGMFVVAERWLLAQSIKPLELHGAVDFARRQFCRIPHKVSVGLVMEEVGLSERRFIELFSGQVGLTPKAFCRVRRFQRILETIHCKSDVDWVDVALECGYYDQAHFIHDFREFSGLTPTQYLARATEHLNHVPVV